MCIRRPSYVAGWFQWGSLYTTCRADVRLNSSKVSAMATEADDDVEQPNKGGGAVWTPARPGWMQKAKC